VIQENIHAAYLLVSIIPQHTYLTFSYHQLAANFPCLPQQYNPLEQTLLSTNILSMETLPEEVLDLVFACLVPNDFLSLCSTSKSFYEQHHLNPFYWRNEASSTFRLPISSLLRADGARWYWLYRKLKTQTRLYTWGQGTNGNLGPTQSSAGIPTPSAPHLPTLPLRDPRNRPRGRGGRRLQPPGAIWQRTSSSWPTQAHLPDEVGIIVDVQCGGWSTNLLTSDGKLFSVGILDAADGRHVGKRFDRFTRLEYLTQSTTNIRQFSAGRRHVLALDDNGEILSWDRINEKGYKIFPRGGRDFEDRVDYVCGGWGYSSAYVPSKGIVYWPPVENSQNDTMLDGVHVIEYVIPDTASRIEMVGDKEDELKVLKHIVLEGWIVFLMGGLTGVDAKVFACRIGPEHQSPANPVFEVPGYNGEQRHLQDLQGSFRSFAVFTAAGEVLAGNTNYLNACAFSLRTDSIIDDDGNTTASRAEVQTSADLLAGRPGDIPILQQNGVIGVAFGDYHCLALHADGTITAHGRDPSGVGALGLGNPPSYAKFRGLRQAGHSRDYDLLPIAARRGRQVWFEPEKKDWLEWLEKSSEESLHQALAYDYNDMPHNRIQDSPSIQAAYSEYVEQEGRHWEDGPIKKELPKHVKKAGSTLDYDSLGAYFAISVTAAGWHSGALVLVNEEKAAAIQEKWMIKSPKPRRMPGHFEDGTDDSELAPYWDGFPFPTIELPDGQQLGHGEVVAWRSQTPSMEELGLDVGSLTVATDT
jgi:SCF-associated factor 1